MLSPAEEEESSCEDHPASSPLAGTQGQSQGEVTGPAKGLTAPLLFLITLSPGSILL